MCALGRQGTQSHSYYKVDDMLQQIIVNIEFNGTPTERLNAQCGLRAILEMSADELAEEIGALLFTMCADNDDVAGMLLDAQFSIKYPG